MTTITVQSDGQKFDCQDGDTILRAALRRGIGMAYSCNVGSCGNCRFELIDGTVEHVRADAPAWGERDLKRNRWLGCQARPKGDCTIKFRADPTYIGTYPPARRNAELVSSRAVTRDITEFTFKVSGDDSFLPGQYALITVPGAEGGRAYSMANLPGSGLWQFQIKRVPGGSATGFLFDNATVGMNLEIDGPYGTAFLRTDSDRDIILMAGGSGLSPMLSIARGAAAAGMLNSRELHFFYGCRSEDDLFDATALLSGLGANLHYTPVLSDARDDAGWSGGVGFLHDFVGQTMNAQLKDHEIYFAGPALMSAAIQRMAHDAQCPTGQLHFDEFY